MTDFTASYAGVLASRITAGISFILKCSQMAEPMEIIQDGRLLEILSALAEVKESLEDAARNRA